MEQAKFKLLNFDELMKHVFLGKYKLNLPIEIQDESKQFMKKLSFTSYLLEYHNIHKGNIHHIMMDQIGNFYRLLGKLLKEDSIQQLVNTTREEWDYDELPDSLPVFDKDRETQLLVELKEGNSRCDGTERLIQHSPNIPIESQLKGENPLKREIESTTLICDEIKGKLNDYLKTLQSHNQELDSIPLELFVDLSMKPHYIYSLLGKETNIPENIQTIFLNFVMMFTLTKKMMIHKEKEWVQLISEFETKTNVVDDLNHNVKQLALGSKPMPSFF